MQQKLILLFLLIAAHWTPVAAQIVTDRPDQTESAVTVPGGSLQIESGIQLSQEGDLSTSGRQVSLPTSLFRYGISDGIELRVSGQYELYKYHREE